MDRSCGLVCGFATGGSSRSASASLRMTTEGYVNGYLVDARARNDGNLAVLASQQPRERNQAHGDSREGETHNPSNN